MLFLSRIVRVGFACFRNCQVVLQDESPEERGTAVEVDKGPAQDALSVYSHKAYNQQYSRAEVRNHSRRQPHQNADDI
eukprot:1849238-Amphidinium_carterae.1